MPEYACGRIIGRGGASIREISTLTNCKVNIDKKHSHSSVQDQPAGALNEIPLIGGGSSILDNDSKSKTKLISLAGSVEQIEAAKVCLFFCWE